jgi:hypothetical protein
MAPTCQVPSFRGDATRRVVCFAEMASVPPIPPGSQTDRPDANYRPVRQNSVDPADVPNGYYELSEPPLRTLVLHRLRKIAGAIRRSPNT